MPIIASENPNTVPEGEQRPSFAPVTISTDIAPARVKVDQVPLHAKLRCFTVTSRQLAQLEFRFQDYKGNPYNLTTRPDNSRFVVRFREAARMSIPTQHRFNNVQVDILDEEQGILNVVISAHDNGVPGIYKGELALLIGDPGKEEIIHSNTFLLYVTQGMFQNRPHRHMNGPPNMLDIRSRIRDATPEENLLIDGYMFQDEEIAQAAIYCIQYWNESPPPIRVYFSTEDFPDQFNWIEGIIGQLLLQAAESYRKNHLEYAGGGLSVNDNAKEPNFLRAGTERWNNFKAFVLARKVKLNTDRCRGIYWSKYAWVNGMGRTGGW